MTGVPAQCDASGHSLVPTAGRCREHVDLIETWYGKTGEVCQQVFEVFELDAGLDAGQGL